MFIFLDESGDLGFDFSKTGTSKTFTITLLVCDDKTIMRGVQNAVKRTLKNKVNAKRKKRKIQELKGTATTPAIKSYFLGKMPKSGWRLYSITLYKSRVYNDLRTKAGKKKLYNFLTKALLETLKPNGPVVSVNLVVDRCKDGEDRKDFNAYIQAYLETTFQIDTKIYITHETSHENAGLQAVDIFCYGIQRKYNEGDDLWHREFSVHIARHIDYLRK